MKKLFAFSLAVVMMLSMSVSVVATTVNTAGQIGGVGTPVVEIPDPLFRMTLPTADSFEFFLDPLGLVGGVPGIVFPEGFNPTFISHSTEDMRLGVEYQITGNVNVLQAVYNPATDSPTSVSVQVVSSSENVDNPTKAFQGSVANDIHNLTLVEYVLPAGDFTIVNQGGRVAWEPRETPNWQGTQIQLQGNLYGEVIQPWADATMNLSIRFSFTNDLDGLIPAPAANPVHLGRVRQGTGIFDTIPQTVVRTSGFLGYSGIGNYTAAPALTRGPVETNTVTPVGFYFDTGEYTITNVYWARGDVRIPTDAELPGAGWAYWPIDPDNRAATGWFGVFFGFELTTPEPVEIVLSSGERFRFYVTVSLP